MVTIQVPISKSALSTIQPLCLLCCKEAKTKIAVTVNIWKKKKTKSDSAVTEKESKEIMQPIILSPALIWQLIKSIIEKGKKV